MFSYAMKFNISTAGRLQNSVQPHPRAYRGEKVVLEEVQRSLGGDIPTGTPMLIATSEYQYWHIDIETIGELVTLMAEYDACVDPRTMTFISGGVGRPDYGPRTISQTPCIRVFDGVVSDKE